MATNDYRRPDREWKCGLSHDLAGCKLGPSRTGRCDEQTCTPRRTLRWWRGYLPWAFLAVTIGTTLVLIGTKQQRSAIVPGPLSMVHAQLIRNPNAADRCSNCHIEGSFQTPMTSAEELSQASAHGLVSAQTQTQKCLACHENSLPQLRSSTPHDLPSDQLEQLTQNAMSKNDELKIALASFDSQLSKDVAKSTPLSTAKVDWHQHALACSDCHREHQGSNHDLQAISSQRCQACHQQAFTSFASGHPEFPNYPRPQTEQISFDHRRHQDLHFAKANAQFDCRQCHLSEGQSGRVGQVFRALSFEQACANCHHEPMKASLLDGIVVFQLPSINVDELKKYGVDVGPWPEEASLMMDGSLPPVMRMLLANDERYSELLTNLPASGELQDLRLDQPADRQIAIELVAAIREMLEEFARLGQVAIERRLTSNRDGASLELPPLVAGLPPDLFRQAYRGWFETTKISSTTPPIFASKSGPVNELRNDELIDSDDLLSGQDSTEQVSTARPSQAELPSQRWRDLQSRTHLQQGGWMIDSQRLAIVYVPARHADPWLTGLLSIGRQQAEDMFKKGSSDADSASQDAITDFAHEFLATNGIGRCTECHRNFRDPTSTLEKPSQSVGWLAKKFAASKDAASDNISLQEAWQSRRSDARVRELTRFDHGPHLIQPRLNDCRVCHVLNMTDQDASVTADLTSLVTSATAISHSEFASMRKDDCASCHRPEAAGDQCVQCHNYHSSAIDYKYMPTKP
jgi:hypothetical protein